ncbi:DUF3081 domain-containing protein [Vibrio mediterranei]|jgi:hypothetical protein|uniref:DUF3081 domain-containing protein n=2 Tax=Vibrio TaxID=662 RepID=A0ABW7IHB4_9VIBR|nr:MULTISPECIES: DUF3081 domain-containing protein [Vibrio]ASI91301.1 hypothetical protein BSZ05_16625 [Vibrio mediterranei]MCG9623655.1 DUF3081 domain-containing protein [Vibrio mediterranei]MCG9787347.1 DUF3081 domain-containing protein [Vibrio mediterranei]NOI23051.1 DUF3081 domain-containing protein [Vibrio mediterranei]OIN25146.1 hypothetical protein AWH66_2017945 [Vibrio barjaei]
MKNELDPGKVLQAYDNIMEHGTDTEFGKIYGGVEAFSDYDGYNVYMRGNGVELKVGFHNTYHLEYDQEHLRDSFLKKVALLAK